MEPGNIADLALGGIGMLSFGVTLFICSMVATDRADPFGHASD